MIRIALAGTALLTLVACIGGTEEEPELYGPDNSWWHANVEDMPEGLAATGGTGMGNRPADFLYTDQFGDQVSLYQFYGKTVQLVLMAQWCGPCQDEAQMIGDAARTLAEDDVIVLEIMLENTSSQLPTGENLNQWTTAYGGTHPVLAPSDSALNSWLLGGFPTLPILDDTLTVVHGDNFPFSEATLAGYAPPPSEEE